MKSLVEKLQNRSIVKKERGASALEYIVLAAVIVIAVSIGAFMLTRDGDSTIGDAFEKISTDLGEAIDQK